MKVALILLLIGQSPEIPAWWKALNPAADIRLRWSERIEKGYDRSAPNFRLRAGVFPRFEEKLLLGLELSSIATTDDSVDFGNAFETKSIGLSQVYLGYEIERPFFLSLRAGKWSLPVKPSPLLLNDALRPEGFLERLGYTFESLDLSASIFGAQLSLDQIESSRFLGDRQRRVWAFLQGLNLAWAFDTDHLAQLTLSSLYYMDVTSQISDFSARRGNSFTGILGNNVSLTEKFLPLDAHLQIEGKPLGLTAGASGAFTINPRSEDWHRGFYAEAHLGNLWKKRSFFLELSYFYSEPDLTVAAFSEEDIGFTNRKGFRGQLDYFFLEQLRLGVSYTYADTVTASPLQSARHEIQGDIEVRF